MAKSGKLLATGTKKNFPREVFSQLSESFRIKMPENTLI
jgi:hypothetical protein